MVALWGLGRCVCALDWRNRTGMIVFVCWESGVGNNPLCLGAC